MITEISITPIPIDRPPFPLPFGAEFPMYFTVQPGGAYIEPYGARIIYPNITNELPGTRINFWNYDAGRKGLVHLRNKELLPGMESKLYPMRGWPSMN